MPRKICVLGLLAASILSAAEFQDYQAARAVIGQASFSAHEKGVTARALSLSKSNLYVAEPSGHVLTYDLSRIGIAKSPGCPVCIATPVASTSQPVFEGVAAVAVSGRTIAIADTKAHRVLIWSGGATLKQPDVVLSGFANPISVAMDGQRLYVGDSVTHHVYIWNTLPMKDSQQPDVTLGTADTSEATGSEVIQTPAALASDGSNLFVGDAAAHRVLVFSPADSAMPQVTNSATLTGGAVAPGTLVSIEHIAGAKSTVVLNGNPIAITETDGDLLQIQIPFELNAATSGSLWIKTELEDGTAAISRPAPVRFAGASPGIFAFGVREPRTGLLLHAPAGIPLSPEDPAKASELLTVWATGLGAVSSESNSDGSFDTLIPLRASINGNSVEVVSAVLPAQAAGVYEVQLRLPSQLPASATLIISANDARSNAVTFPVESGK